MNNAASSLLGLGFVGVFAGLLFIFALLARRRMPRNFREISGFAKLRRAVGLAVEAGTRLHISLGSAGLTSAEGAPGLAGISMLERATRAAAVSDRPPVATSGDGLMGALSQEASSTVLKKVSADQEIDLSMGRVTGVTPFSYAAGTMPVIHDEHVSTNILVGHFGPEVALLTEASERSGNLTIAGTDQVAAQAVLYAAAQEPLIGEEVFAGGAYLGAGAGHAASLQVQDILRWAIIVVIIFGALARLLGVL